MPRSQRSGSPYCTRIASPDGVQSIAVSFGFLSSFLSSSVSTRSRDPSATDATYQPFLLVNNSFEPSRENETIENDSRLFLAGRGRRRRRILLRLRRDRARLLFVDALHEHLALVGIGQRPPIVRPSRRRGLQVLRVEHGARRTAARHRPHRIVGPEDHVVVGLLGLILQPRHRRVVAREFIAGDGGRRHHGRSWPRSQDRSARARDDDWRGSSRPNRGTASTTGRRRGRKRES